MPSYAVTALGRLSPTLASPSDGILKVRLHALLGSCDHAGYHCVRITARVPYITLLFIYTGGVRAEHTVPPGPAGERPCALRADALLVLTVRVEYVGIEAYSGVSPWLVLGSSVEESASLLDSP